MSYPVALILAVEASIDIPAAIGDDALEWATERFLWRRVRGGDPLQSTFTAGGITWKLFIIQPLQDTTRAVGKALKTRIDAMNPSKVRCFTPSAFAAVAPPAVVQAVRDSWWVVWRAESSAAGVAAQQGYGDADLDREEDPDGG